MVLTSEFSIAGVRLFSDHADIESQLPSEALQQRFLSIADSVSNLTNYKESSRFEQLLRLRTNLNATEKGTFTSIVRNTTNTVGFCKATSPTNLFDGSYPSALLEPTINADLVKSIKARMAEDLDRLNFAPLGKGAPETIQSFRALMMGICTKIFEYYYPQFRLLLPDLPEIYNYERYTLIFTDYLQKNASKSADIMYSNACGDETYFKEIHTRLLSYANSPEAQVDAVQKNTAVIRIFLSCFFPYFQFNFYLNHIPTQRMDSMDKAPRYFIMMRIAILAVYMSLFYFTLILCGTGTISDDVRKLMSKINDVLFAQELSMMYHGMTYANVHQEATDNRELSKNLNYITKDITISRGNLNKALTNDTAINGSLHRSTTIKWVWFTILFVAIVGCVVLYFVAIDFLYIFTLLILGVLAISGIVGLSKKF